MEEQDADRPRVPLQYLRRPKGSPRIPMPPPSSGHSARDAARAAWAAAEGPDGAAKDGVKAENLKVTFHGKGRLGLHFAPDQLPLRVRHVEEDGLAALVDPRITRGLTLLSVNGTVLAALPSYEDAMDTMRKMKRPMVCTFSPPLADVKATRKKQSAGKLLRYATWRSEIEEIRAMVEYEGVDLELMDPDDLTPLLVAARWGRLEVLLELLELGADINARTRLGDSAYNLAVDNGHAELAQELEDAGCSTAENPAASARREAARAWLMPVADSARQEQLQALSNAELKARARETGLAAVDIRGIHQPEVRARVVALILEREQAASEQLHLERTGSTRREQPASAAELEFMPALEDLPVPLPRGPAPQSPRSQPKHFAEDSVFRVGQHLHRDVPWASDLIIGQAGITLTNGRAAIQEWRYDELTSALAVGRAADNSGELHLVLREGGQLIKFDTLKAKEISQLVCARLGISVEEGVPESAAHVSEGVPVSRTQEPEPEPEPELEIELEPEPEPEPEMMQSRLLRSPNSDEPDEPAETDESDEEEETEDEEEEEEEQQQEQQEAAAATAMRKLERSPESLEELILRQIKEVEDEMSQEKKGRRSRKKGRPRSFRSRSATDTGAR